MHKPEFIRENGKPKILWDFEIQTDHLIPAKRLDLLIANKKEKEKRTSQLVDLAIPAFHKVKPKENETRDEYFDLVRELKKCYSTWRWWWYDFGKIPKGSVKGLEELEIERRTDISKLQHC